MVYRRQELTSHSSGGQKVQDQGAGSFGAWRGLASWYIDRWHLLAVSSHGGRVREFSEAPLWDHSGRLYPHGLIPSQCPTSTYRHLGVTISTHEFWGMGTFRPQQAGRRMEKQVSVQDGTDINAETEEKRGEAEGERDRAGGTPRRQRQRLEARELEERRRGRRSGDTRERAGQLRVSQRHARGSHGEGKTGPQVGRPQWRLLSLALCPQLTRRR